MEAPAVAPRALSVLVAEDDAALRAMLTALLTRLGYDFECVSDGARALERLSRRSWNAFLLDLVMPRTNGYDVLERLAENGSPILARTIVITGVTEKEIARIDSSAVFAVMRKPFDIDELIATIEACATAVPRRGPRPTSRRGKRRDEESDSLPPSLTA